MGEGQSAQHEETTESRWEAAPAVLAVIGLQLLLAFVSFERHWRIWHFPWWVWTIGVVPESILLVSLAWDSARRTLERIGHRRNAALALLGIISVENAIALIALIGSLVNGNESSGGQLLLKGMTIWGTNVIAYGLWFWGVDRGGPVRRRQPNPPPPDFQFPQMENPTLAEPGLAPAALRLHLHLVHELDRVQPNGRNAAHPPREDADALRVGRLGAQHPARDCACGQHLQVALFPSERPRRRLAAVANERDLTETTPAGGLTVRCAWCARIKVGDEWIEDADVQAMRHGPATAGHHSHGICPDCFAQLTPPEPL